MPPKPSPDLLRVRALLVDEHAVFEGRDAAGYAALRTMVSKAARNTGKRYRIRANGDQVRVLRVA